MSVSCRIATREIILTKTDKVMLLFGEATEDARRGTRDFALRFGPGIVEL
jgi:hypothetical protein